MSFGKALKELTKQNPENESQKSDRTCLPFMLWYHH